MLKRVLVLSLALFAAVATRAQITSAPTSPTESPTSPSASPTAPTPPTTQKPTTKTPTQKPTVPTKSPTFRPTVNPTATIYLYSNNVWEIDGDLGTRAETSWYCENIAVTLNLFCATHAAFLSYSASDNIANLPLNHLGASKTSVPVKSASGVLIASNWTDMFNYPRPVSFLDAGVFPYPGDGIEVAFLTGSEPDGTFRGEASTCNSWTSAIATDKMTVGQASNTNENLIYYGDADCDGAEMTASHTKAMLVCACFHDGA
jgi:hypothetical protein